MYQLILCELHCPEIHGKTDDSNANIENHYMVYDTFDPITKLAHSNSATEYCDYEYTSIVDCEQLDDNLVYLDDEIAFLKMIYSNIFIMNHPTIRNYNNIVSRPDYIRAEIGDTILLPTGENVAILKTFWLRIIQRKWKRIFREKNNKRQ
jgi:hypothetical protein